jgi:predicted methyltransferase
VIRYAAGIAAGLLLLASTACRSSAPATSEPSVRPGVNEAYQDPDVETWVGRFEREGRETYDLRREIVAACVLQPGDDVADVGAGTGLFVPLFAGAVGRTGSVVAVDIVPEFTEHIETRAREAGLDNVRTVLCTERSVELPAGSVDLVFLCDTYHHLEYPQSTMTSIHEALRPEGTLIVIDFDRDPEHSRDWILDHVRAGRETVIAEIEDYGFRLVETIDVGLRENYMVRFERR